MSAASTISVVCSCGKRLKAPATAIGKKARCPVCASTIVLSAPDDITAPINAASAENNTIGLPPSFENGLGDEENGLDAMYELAGQSSKAPVASDVVICPQCRSEMGDGAVLCTKCGYNVRTGKATNVGPVAAQTNAGKIATLGYAPGAPVDHMAPNGSLILGVIFSAVFALVASIVWIIAVWLSGYTIGYIAILIGAAAGVGMQVGHKGYSRMGGIIAAAMTVLAIFVAKVVVLEIILARSGKNVSIFALNPSKLGYYFFNPIGLIIIAVGVGAAFRTANGSAK